MSEDDSLLEDVTVSPHMSGFLAIVAGLIISRLAPASQVCWLSERTSSSTIRSVGETLYYIGVTG
mgnify:CR=1 FL=1